MPDAGDRHGGGTSATGWRFVAIGTIVVGAAMLLGPPAGLDGAVAAAAAVLIALIAYAVSRPASTGPIDGDPWIVVRNCPNVQAAFFVRAALEGSDIESLIPDEHTANMRSELVTAIGGVRVWVRASDFDRAAEMLDAGERKWPR